MRFNEDWYDTTATTYTRFIRVHSQNCAHHLNKIRSAFGALAAYRAAFAIMQLRAEAERTAKVKDVEKYRQLLIDHPEALPLFELAMQAFLEDALGQPAFSGRRANTREASNC